MRYDDDDSEEEGRLNRVGKGVKRVARGTRRMSLVAAGGVKKATAKVAGAGNAVKQKGKKKKKKKKSSKKDRGRSESPRRTSNSKPPVTKTGLRSLFSAKRWRSASPAVGRGKSRKVTPEEQEPIPIDPVPAPMYQPVIPPGGPASYNGYDPMMAAGHQEPAPPTSLGVSLRSMSSGQRYQRNMNQEKIERDNQVPLFSVLLNSSHFIKYCDIAFDLVDSNGDEAVDDTELYAGLLLIHLKLGSFLGPAACKPLSRERCSAMFQRFDSTGTGGLDRTEFRRVMMVLFANVFARVLVQFSLTILIVPLVAKSVLRFLTLDTEGWWDFWTKPKYYRRIGEELTLDDYLDWRITSFPSPRRTFFTKLYRFFRIGSDEFWDTFPLTFLTIILGLVIAPMVLYYFDDLFQFAVDWKGTKRKEARKR